LNSYSGARLNRPGLDSVRDAVRERSIDRLMLTTPDRLARNYVHQMVLLEEFEQDGCQVEFVDRPMSQDPHDQLLLQIRGAVAAYERTPLAERMRHGRLAKLRAGAVQPIRSMPRKGCSPYNAACEGFFGRLKTELFYPRDWQATTLEQFIQAVDAYIRWHNEKRIKISLGSLRPSNTERASNLRHNPV
jgi:DNA invertase Pin-like site-specific DNA recombinase